MKPYSSHHMMLLLLISVSILVGAGGAANAQNALPGFPAGSPWQQDVSQAPLDPESSDMTAWLVANGGWGFGRLQIDSSIHSLDADCNTPRVPFTKKNGYYQPDCDDINNFPVPNAGALEGTSNWAESATCAGDCHLIVMDRDSGLLWESWDTSVTVDAGTGRVTSVSSTCAVVWNTSTVYPSSGRGEGCTSADAAGFPIATLLFTPEEVLAGSIDHAIRFILPNARMRAVHYAHPASHYGGPTAPSTGKAPIYGSRWRLKASFDISSFPPPAQVILRALKKHGMLLSDGGNVALTSASETFRSTTWAQAGLTDSSPFDSIVPTDFEVVQAFGDNPRVYGRDVPSCGASSCWPNCVRNPISLNYAPFCPAASATSTAGAGSSTASGSASITSTPMSSTVAGGNVNTDASSASSVGASWVLVVLVVSQAF